MAIIGTVKVHEHTFVYGEVSKGRSRGISMHREGVADDQHVYMFDPNPHDEKAYIKSPTKFYLQAAQRIAEITVNTGWPAFNVQINVLAVPYNLIDR